MGLIFRWISVLTCLVMIVFGIFSIWGEYKHKNWFVKIALSILIVLLVFIGWSCQDKFWYGDDSPVLW